MHTALSYRMKFISLYALKKKAITLNEHYDIITSPASNVGIACLNL